MKRRELVIDPAWDKRNTDPEKDYGVHCADIRMFVHGEDGVVQFVLSTGWHLPHIAGGYNIIPPYPIPADLGYHSRKPKFEDQYKTEACPYLGGEPCYYDGSGLNAEEVFKLLVAEGSEKVWKYLEKYYDRIFNGEVNNV